MEETSHRSSIDFHGNGEESSFEFWPVQHPSEPPEEDRPIECPMPADSSVINGNNKLQQKFSERLQRNSAVFNREKRLDRVLPIRATRKRHHGEPMTKPLLGRHSLDQFLPPRGVTMFQMLNKFDS
ncbi:unnamed protein product [Fraxinus pennsylvanica]|uniref:Uncharacterized protein n=1 Tax=Fraxinus pennsylvanica TaxID=56036 RepID=A0AAD2A075_9LAMI|nr:unnamed protein product [Fraxinus pennsylvanica]